MKLLAGISSVTIDQNDRAHDGKDLGLPRWMGWLALFVALAALAYIWPRGMQHYFADDAYIAYRFAKNVADGWGFVWNPGDLPVFGTTSFLHVYLTAFGIKLGFDPLLFNRALQGACFLLAAVAVHRVVSIITADAVVSLGAAALFLIHPAAAAQPVHGMETGFWIASHAFALLALVGRSSFLLGLAAAVLTALRPEGAGFAVAYAVLAFLVDGRSGLRAAIFAVIGMAAVLAIEFLSLGAISPAAAQSKVDGTARLVERLLPLPTKHFDFLLRYAVLPSLAPLMLALASQNPINLRLLRISRSARIAIASFLLGAAVLVIYYPTNLKMNIYFRFHSIFVVYFVVTVAFLFRLGLDVRERNSASIVTTRFSAVIALGLLSLILLWGWKQAADMLVRDGDANTRSHHAIAMLIDKHKSSLSDKLLFSTSAGILNYYWPGKAIYTFPGGMRTYTSANEKLGVPDILIVTVATRVREISDPSHPINAPMMRWKYPLEEYQLAGQVTHLCDPDAPYQDVQVFIRKSRFADLTSLAEDVKTLGERTRCPYVAGLPDWR